MNIFNGLKRHTQTDSHSFFRKFYRSCFIGGLGLACYGSIRATMDLDLLIHGNDKDKIKKLLTQGGFNLVNESEEVLQFSGPGYVDILLARRPFTQEMLRKAHENGPEGIKFVRIEDLIGLKIQAYKNDKTREFQDKADIQYLIQAEKNINWNLVKNMLIFLGNGGLLMKSGKNLDLDEYFQFLKDYFLLFGLKKQNEKKSFPATLNYKYTDRIWVFTSTL